MKRPTLYRKRLIPEECILLKDDELLYRDEKTIITRWNTLKPKKDLHHGFSCYFLDKGVKVSKFYKADGTQICWYCVSSPIPMTRRPIPTSLPTCWPMFWSIPTASSKWWTWMSSPRPTRPAF